ncbi:probable fatty acyl-CoA reductase 4 [Cryptomeria japonica]|uniref:probable fatty acyl-CoA reductase 4 n=1 Tax=Cryptomeria japonica TaxID=3369 RepID=UPI0025AD84E3|nr:probable fatty acyl-CoA reductase 4 [Cryptomeria japonica]
MSAYVNVGSRGMVREEVVRMGERVPYSGGEISVSQIEFEYNLIEQIIEEFKNVLAEAWSEEKESKYMKEFGAQRAMNFGWPNVYVFTKAIGELMVDYFREYIPTVIIRPTIIESCIKDPLPGWMEGNRMIDPVIIGYGKGRISFFLAAPQLVLDVIPVDVVANCMIASIARNASQSGLSVYHVASSNMNPLKYNVIVDASYNYFSAHPCTSRNGRIVLYIVDKLLLGYFRLQPLYTLLLEKYKFALKLAQIYEPFLFFKGTFDISNMEDLWNKMSERDQENFNFDVKSIDWKRYFMNCHIPGLVKYVMRG